MTPPSRARGATLSSSPSRVPDSSFAPASFKSGHLNLDTLSPVNQNGSFEFDKVLKSGRVHRRTKKKGAWRPSWKPAFLVLRPNLLSIYETEDETGLRGNTTLSEVTAVLPVKKQNTDNVFGVFTPSKNYHFQGTSARDTADWIERIKAEALVHANEELFLASPQRDAGRQENQAYETTDLSTDEDTERPTSPEVAPCAPFERPGSRSRALTAPKRQSNLHEHAGNEMLTSYSDFSDAPPVGSLPTSLASSLPKTSNLSPPTADRSLRPDLARNASQLSGFDISHDPERVIRHGWLHCLKTKGGVKQWKTLWAVLRPKNLSFYKNEQEYSLVRLFPMSSVVNAAEMDPISRSKQFCLQIIFEDKTYRFAAPAEDALAKWLGALKSVLAKRQESVKQISDGAAAISVR